MMPAVRRAFLGLVGLGSSLVAQATGVVEVRWIDPAGYADIGWGSFDRDQALQALAGQFAALSGRLPDGQVLRVEVLDVDLAGRLELHGARQVRVLRGRADWPHMTLRYALKSGDQVLQQGEANLAALDYLPGRAGAALREPLPYERAMIDAWFNETFGARIGVR